MYKKKEKTNYKQSPQSTILQLGGSFVLEGGRQDWEVYGLYGGKRGWGGGLCFLLQKSFCFHDVHLDSICNLCICIIIHRIITIYAINEQIKFCIFSHIF